MEARASTLSITLSAEALNTTASINFTTSTSTIATDIDLVEAGFQEGDILKLSVVGGGSNNNKKVRIDSFVNNNKPSEL